MFPTYKDGDWLLVSWFPAGLTSSVGDRILGKVVVVEREERPGIFLVKRLQKSHGGIYWVQGDNDESTDSRTWGWIPGNEIVGVVRFRYKRGKDLPTPKL
jgi:phage repressor protein C with HTH and peptisase S24 domain